MGIKVTFDQWFPYYTRCGKNLQISLGNPEKGRIRENGARAEKGENFGKRGFNPSLSSRGLL